VGLLAPVPELPLEPEPPLELPPLELSPPPVLEPPVPEEASPVLGLDPLELSPPPELDCSPELDELDSPELSLEPAELDLAVVEVVEVVDVEVVRAASLSADVLLGGMMSGVLWGTTSAELPPPPQALRVRPASNGDTVTAIATTDRRPAGDWPGVGRRAGLTSPAAPFGVRR
jgi:hypothetical protein